MKTWTDRYLKWFKTDPYDPQLAPKNPDTFITYKTLHNIFGRLLWPNLSEDRTETDVVVFVRTIGGFIALDYPEFRGSLLVFLTDTANNLYYSIPSLQTRLGYYRDDNWLTVENEKGQKPSKTSMLMLIASKLLKLT